MKIRTITTGISLPFAPSQLERAATFNAASQTYFESNGYDVQTTRVSSQIWDEVRDIDAILGLESRAQALGIDFLNLGTILPGKQSTKTHLAQVADVIAQTERLFATVTVTTQFGGVASEITENTADIIQQIATPN